MQTIEKHRLIRLSEVLAYLPVSRATWWVGVKSGRFPQPVKLGERITCWRLADIIQLTERPDDDGSARPSDDRR